MSKIFGKSALIRKPNQLSYYRNHIKLHAYVREMCNKVTKEYGSLCKVGDTWIGDRGSIFISRIYNIYVVEQMQNAIEGGLSNVWHQSNIAGETRISYLTYDYINKKVYSTDTKNLVTHITGVEFNALYPSTYSSITMR
jgi:hypothetical protein